MDILHAVVLALVQGITEFLPVSSSAHLILIPALLGWPDQGLAFDVAVHVGTLVAVIVFLRKELALMIPGWFSGWRSFEWNEHGKLAWLLVLSTVPLGLIGLLSKDYVEAHLRSPAVIAATTLVFGFLLAWADRRGDQNKAEMRHIGVKSALVVGLAQAIALVPGTSRSGITMTALLAMGFSRVASAKYSFLMAVPAITLPGLLKGVELASETQAEIVWLPLVVGVVVSAVVALACMHWFIRFVQQVGMLPFVVYRILLAGAIAWFLW